MKITYLVCLLLTTVACVTSKYLAQKPIYITSCRLNSANFGKCFGKNFEIYFREWKDGIPGLKSLGALDPLRIKRVKFVQDNSETLKFDLDLQNVFARGISLATIKEASYDPSKNVAKFLVNMPKLRFDFEYKVNGRVVALNLNGQGTGFMETDNSLLALVINMHYRTENGLVFTDVDSIKTSFPKIGNFRIQLKNLFGGQKDLEDSANALFNENWREFFEIMRPGIEQTVEAVLTNYFKKAFAYVPASYFIEDLKA